MDTNLAGMSPKDRLLLRSQAEPWTPEEVGAYIGGICFGTTVASSDFGEYPLAWILTDDGKPVTVHAFHATLRKVVERLVAGDRFDCVYEGTKPSKVRGQSDVHLYQCEVTKGVGFASPAANFAEQPF